MMIKRLNQIILIMRMTMRRVKRMEPKKKTMMRAIKKMNQGRRRSEKEF